MPHSATLQIDTVRLSGVQSHFGSRSLRSFPANATLLITIYYFRFYGLQITNFFLLIYAIFQQHSISILYTSRRNRTSVIYVRITGRISGLTCSDTTRKNTKNGPYLGIPRSIDPVNLCMPWDTRTLQGTEPKLTECRLGSRVISSHVGVFVHPCRWGSMVLGDFSEKLH